MCTRRVGEPREAAHPARGCIRVQRVLQRTVSAVPGFGVDLLDQL